MPELKLQRKSNFSRTQNYWDAFWEHQLRDRPCTVIWAKKNYNVVPPGIIHGVDDEFFKTFEKHDLYLESNAFLGECRPDFRSGFGPDQMADFFGVPIIKGLASINTSWSEKIVDDWKKFSPLTLKENSKCFSRMVDSYRAQATRYRADKHKSEEDKKTMTKISLIINILKICSLWEHLPTD